MRIYKNINTLIKKIDKIKKAHKTICFVPTMGFLHEGHLSIIKKAHKDADYVIVSIFVNPIQFGPGEDLNKYPRDLRRDFGLCRKEGVDIIFVPDAGSLYPAGYRTYVNVEYLSDVMCGAFRPGHFRGVLTIVTKLFNIIRPDIMYLGQKDAQQAVLIKKMVRDLNMPVKIKIMPIVREKDGLAMSSRNIYLHKEERQEALCLYKSLKLAKDLFREGESDSKIIIRKMCELIARESTAKIDYVSIVDPDSLEGLDRISKEALVALAVRIGQTRLIDNTILKYR